MPPEAIQYGANRHATAAGRGGVGSRAAYATGVQEARHPRADLLPVAEGVWRAAL